MEKSALSAIFVLVLCIGIKNVNAVACPQCMDVSFTLRNMPSLYRMILESSLSALSDSACKHNYSPASSCPAPTPYSTTDKCLATTVTLDAKGLIGILPDAEMTVTVTIRDCGGEGESQCINLEDMPASVQAEITQQVASLGNQWSSVAFSGNVCVNDP